MKSLLPLVPFMVPQNPFGRIDQLFAQPFGFFNDKIRVQREERSDEFFDAVKFAVVAVLPGAGDDLGGEFDCGQATGQRQRCGIGDLHLDDGLIRSVFLAVFHG